MLRRRLAGLSLAMLTICLSFCALSLGIAGQKDKAKGQASDGEAVKERAPAAPPSRGRDAAERKAQITKMVNEYDLKPRPLPTIPDDPPPHEGAMISIPNVVEPPDLILVEVLEALPGRPISGERLVRPDGTISIGFYGEVDVRGLTLDQVKVAIIKHLRKYLSDEILGLQTRPPDVRAEEGNPLDLEPERKLERPPTPELPAGEGSPFDLEPTRKDEPKPRSTSSKPSSFPQIRGARSGARGSSGIRAFSGSRLPRIVRVSAQDQPAPARGPNVVLVPVGPQGKVTITIDIQGQNGIAVQNAQVAPIPQEVPPAIGSEDGPWMIVPPGESDRVFVDITAYNSKNFYVLGDVMIPGKLPWTGNETVLDVLQFAGGLMSSAEPKDISLVRPGRNGRPTKVYKVDLAAIREKGDVTSNYQIFPNDRLIVGRDEIVKKTVAMDRLAAPIQTASSSIHNVANMLRAVQLAGQSNSGAILKTLVDFWAKEAARKGDLKFDEDTLREVLLQERKPTPNK